MPRLDGLIASVGSDCHFDRTAIAPHISSLYFLHRHPLVRPINSSVSSDALVDSYLTHLTVERRLAANSVESYARDLALLNAFAAGRASLDQLTRADLEALVRDLMGEGRSPRSVARAVACFRGFYRFLVIDGRLKASPGRRPAAPARVEGTAALSLGGRGRSTDCAAGCVRAARPARPRAHRTAVCDGHACV
jgi:hypothetical protein